MSVLLDTNVLVYLYDDSVPQKHVQAQSLLSALEWTGFGALSTQVLAELFSVMTRKLRHKMSRQTALAELERHARTWTVFEVTTPVVLAAARAANEHHIHFWDAQLWAVAKLNSIPTILSEDFNSGSSLQGVRFVNPFAPGFKPPYLM